MNGFGAGSVIQVSCGNLDGAVPLVLWARTERALSRSCRMTKPLVVSIPHSLGKAEATRRLQTGVGQLKSQFGDKIATVESQWAGDRMTFRVGAMGQTVTGHLDVADDNVRVEVMLPWVLAMVAEKAKGLIQKQGTLLLEKK